MPIAPRQQSFRVWRAARSTRRYTNHRTPLRRLRSQKSHQESPQQQGFLWSVAGLLAGAAANQLRGSEHHDSLSTLTQGLDKLNTLRQHPPWQQQQVDFQHSVVGKDKRLSSLACIQEQLNNKWLQTRYSGQWDQSLPWFMALHQSQWLAGGDVVVLLPQQQSFAWEDLFKLLSWQGLEDLPRGAVLHCTLRGGLDLAGQTPNMPISTAAGLPLQGQVSGALSAQPLLECNLVAMGEDRYKLMVDISYAALAKLGGQIKTDAGLQELIKAEADLSGKRDQTYCYSFILHQPDQVLPRIMAALGQFDFDEALEIAHQQNIPVIYGESLEHSYSYGSELALLGHSLFEQRLESSRQYAQGGIYGPGQLKEALHCRRGDAWFGTEELQWQETMKGQERTRVWRLNYQEHNNITHPQDITQIVELAYNLGAQPISPVDIDIPNTASWYQWLNKADDTTLNIDISFSHTGIAKILKESTADLEAAYIAAIISTAPHELITDTDRQNAHHFAEILTQAQGQEPEAVFTALGHWEGMDFVPTVVALSKLCGTEHVKIHKFALQGSYVHFVAKSQA